MLTFAFMQLQCVLSLKCEPEPAAKVLTDGGLVIIHPTLQEEAFWQKRQVKLRQMSGLKFSDENYHEPEQENYCAVPLSPPLQLSFQVSTPESHLCRRMMTPTQSRR